MMTQQTPTATRWLTRTLAPCLLALSACLLEPLGELPNLECSSLLDTDLDGVPDCQDNCPKLANTAQIDDDLDGVGDRCAVDGWLLFSQFERTTIADDDFGHGYSADRQALQLASPSPTGRYLAFASPDKRNVIVRSQPFVGATAETVATLSIREGISQINWSPDERHHNPQHRLCVSQGVQLGASEVVLIALGISANNSSNSVENFRLYSAGTWVQYTYQTAYETIQTQPQYLQPY